MRIISIEDRPGRVIEQFGSVGARHLGGIRFDGGGGWALLSIEPGSHLGRHEAALDQLFFVVEGSGWIAGADGVRSPIGAGQAALWEKGEHHESGSDDGMKVAVLEAQSITVP